MIFLKYARSLLVLLNPLPASNFILPLSDFFKKTPINIILHFTHCKHHVITQSHIFGNFVATPVASTNKVRAKARAISITTIRSLVEHAHQIMCKLTSMENPTCLSNIAHIGYIFLNQINEAECQVSSVHTETTEEDEPVPGSSWSFHRKIVSWSLSSKASVMCSCRLKKWVTMGLMMVLMCIISS